MTQTRQAIGIDIGGTKTVVAAVDERHHGGALRRRVESAARRPGLAGLLTTIELADGVDGREEAVAAPPTLSRTLASPHEYRAPSSAEVTVTPAVSPLKSIAVYARPRTYWATGAQLAHARNPEAPCVSWRVRHLVRTF